MSRLPFAEWIKTAQAVENAPAMAQNPRNDSVSETARRLHLFRLALDMSQAEIARQSGIEKATWNNAETGDNKLGIENALKLAQKWGMTLDYLYRGDIRGLPSDIAAKIAKIEQSERPRQRA